MSGMATRPNPPLWVHFGSRDVPEAGPGLFCFTASISDERAKSRPSWGQPTIGKGFPWLQTCPLLQMSAKWRLAARFATKHGRVPKIISFTLTGESLQIAFHLRVQRTIGLHDVQQQVSWRRCRRV
jgi:hypothetical protein